MSRAPIGLYVVEDQPALLKNLVKALGLFPELKILGTAQDGEAALAELVPLKPEVVLLDLELPSLSGIEVCRRIKRRLPDSDVLILTSFDDEQKVFEAIQAGASGYLVKRVGPEKIHSAIHEVRAGGTVLEAQIARRFWTFFQSLKASPPEKVNPWGLSETEIEVLGYVAKGLSNVEVGQAMTLERRTVRTHLSHIYRKMGVSSHVDAVVLAMKSGLVQT